MKKSHIYPEYRRRITYSLVLFQSTIYYIFSSLTKAQQKGSGDCFDIFILKGCVNQFCQKIIVSIINSIHPVNIISHFGPSVYIFEPNTQIAKFQLTRWQMAPLFTVTSPCSPVTSGSPKQRKLLSTTHQNGCDALSCIK